MSITVYLKQISPRLLEAMLADSSIVRLVVEAEPNVLEKFLQSQGKDVSSVDAMMQSLSGMDENLQQTVRQGFEAQRQARDRVAQMESFSSEDVEALYLDKSWHSIHFLLTGESWGGEPPLSNALMGGTNIGEEDGTWGYGVPRYLTPDEVQAVASALDSISLEELKRRFDPDKMAAAELYAFHADEEELQYILPYYEKLVNYYHNAAGRGYAVMIYAR